MSKRTIRTLFLSLLAPTILLFTAGCGGSGGGTGPAAPSSGSTPAPFTGKWVELGPKPLHSSVAAADLSGRVTCLLQTNAVTTLLGTAGGGVWRSTDGGTTWTPTTASQASAIGALAVDPNAQNVVLAGTGSRNGALYPDPRGSDPYFPGAGILKSTDGGQSWTTMPGSHVFDRMGITRILIDPANSQQIFVATDQASYGGAQAFGLYRSTDGGATYTNLDGAGQLPAGSQVMDLAFQPGNATVIVASVLNDGVYYSTDGGDTWTRATGLPDGDIGRISLAAAPSSPGVFYALVGRSDADSFWGLYRSADGGQTWSSVALDGNAYNLDGNSGVNQAIIVSPTDPNTVYVGGTELTRIYIDFGAGRYYTAQLTQGAYDQGGNSTGAQAGSPSANDFALAYGPGGILMLGTSGGIWSLSNPSTCNPFGSTATPSNPPNWTDLNHGLDTLLTYGVAFDAASGIGVVGTDENGNATSLGSLTWQQVSQGNGVFPEIASSGNDLILTDSSSLSISTDGGASFSPYMTGIDQNELSTYPYLPLDLVDNSQGTHLATALQSVYESQPLGANWVAVPGSPVVSGNDVVMSLAYAPSNPNFLYAGTSNGHVFVRDTAGGALTDRSTGLPAGQQIQSLAVDPSDPNTAYCAVAAFDVGHVFKTTDAGATWTDISGNLPNLPTLCVKQVVTSQFDLLLAGNTEGVFVSQDDGTTWSQAGTGLPDVPVFSMTVDQADGYLGAATFGRGVWGLSLNPTHPLVLRSLRGSVSLPAGQPPASPAAPRPPERQRRRSTRARRP